MKKQTNQFDTMKRIAKFLGRYPFFLFLLPVFVIVHLEKDLHGIIHYELVYDRILIFFAIPVLVFLIFYPLFRSVKKSSLMTLTFLILFYYAGELKNWLSVTFPGSIWQSYSFLLSVFTISLLVLFFVLKKSKSDLHRLRLYINAVLFLFILADVIVIISGISDDKYAIVSEPEIKKTSYEDSLKPDIYYLLTDTYTSSERLLSEFGYSNHAIEDDLKSKGFFIIPESRSNYNYTGYSLGSTLNMNYIKNVDTVNKTTDREYMQAVKLMLKNRVFSFFQKENYRIFNHSIFDVKDFPTSIHNIDFWNIVQIFDQYNLLFKMVKELGYHFPPWIKELVPNDRYYINSPQNRSNFSKTRNRQLLETIKLECNQPKFVYAHFLRLHPPYFYDSTGEFFKSDDIERHEAYLHQIVSLNEYLKQIADSIMFYAKRPLVIIIQGDHGISFFEPIKPEDSFPNFSAMYFSNKDYRLLSDSTHNVNTFRIILNTFFKENMDLLPYQSYFLKW